MRLSLKCKMYGDRDHTPCSGTTDDGTESACECRCHTYTVRIGDTIGGIAGRLGVSASELAILNGLPVFPPRKLYTGQHLTVPGDG